MPTALAIPLHSPEWDAAQKHLQECHVPMAFEHRSEVRRLAPRRSHMFYVPSAPPFAAVLEDLPVPLVPGHRVLRGWRIRPPEDPSTMAEFGRLLVSAARLDPRILQIKVQLFDPDEGRRARGGHVLGELGLRRVDQPDLYTETLVIDLQRDPEEILGGFSRSARRNIRETERKGLAVRPITDPSLASRLDALYRETFARTGAPSQAVDWGEVITLSRAFPELARLVGAFSAEPENPESLLAFAWGRSHGDHADYSHGGSTRVPGVRVPLAYPLIWDLVRWAHGLGVPWFDLGGVTRGSAEEEGDPLGGISDFKRFFSDRVVTIAEEWVYEPPTVRSRLARKVRRVLKRRP